MGEARVPEPKAHRLLAEIGIFGIVILNVSEGSS